MKKQFRIIELTETVVGDISNRTYDPHLHDFEELILLVEGSLTHYIDLTAEEVTAPAVCYIATGKMHRIQPNSTLRGWVVNFKPEFTPNSSLNFYSNFNSSANIPFGVAACLNRLDTICRLLQTESSWDSPDLPTLKHLTNALISMVDAERRRSVLKNETVKDHHLETFGSFLQILESNFRRNLGVAFYADKLNMSERNLNLICKSIQNKSVSEIIDTRRMVEAKALLIHSSKSVSEIGYELGYNEKSYFTRLFRSRTGLTPTSFREQMRSAIA